MTNHTTVLKHLDAICGCTHAAKEAARGYRELMAERDALLSIIQSVLNPNNGAIGHLAHHIECEARAATSQPTTNQGEV